jgi:hypothetical protein
LFFGCATKINYDEFKLPENKILAYECRLVDQSGKLIYTSFGNNCEYFNDGSYVSIGIAGLVHVSKYSIVNIRKRFVYHHMVRKIDEYNFILLSSSFHKVNQKMIRFDRVSIYNKSLKELKYFDFYEKSKSLNKFIPKKLWGRVKLYLNPTIIKTQHKGVQNISKIDGESSHANSVYKIPENKLSKIIPAFSAGNFIVNVDFIGYIFILDKNLKNILWSIEAPKFNLHAMLHDVQVTEEGKLLYFNNRFTDSFSSIETMDVQTLKREVLFEGNNINKFHSIRQGSVQMLDDEHYGVSEIDDFNKKSRFFVFSAKTKKIVYERQIKSAGFEGDSLAGFQELKLVNLEEFLKNTHVKSYKK